MPALAASSRASLVVHRLVINHKPPLSRLCVAASQVSVALLPPVDAHGSGSRLRDLVSVLSVCRVLYIPELPHVVVADVLRLGEVEEVRKALAEHRVLI